MELNKSEIKTINEYEQGKFNPEEIGSIEDARGKQLYYIILISHGRRYMHDSGYPFIKMIGKGTDGKFYNLGWHDHYICNEPSNTDSLGKNVFRLMPWCNDKPWVVSNGFWSSSTIEIGEPTYYSKRSETEVIIR